jgi:hypothetical protein
MGFFDKLKDKAKQAFENVQDETNDKHVNEDAELHEEETDEVEEFDFDSADESKGDNTDYTIMPKGWEGLSDEDVLGKISVVGLEYYNRGDDENYLIEQGFMNERHLGKFKEYFEMKTAEKLGISLIDLVGYSSNATQQYMLKEAQKKTGSGGALEPVEGITCENWAMVNAKIASGSSTDDAIKLIGCDLAKWDRVNNEWLARMSNDLTFSISQVYAKAFTSSSTGNMGGASDLNEQN